MTAQAFASEVTRPNVIVQLPLHDSQGPLCQFSNPKTSNLSLDACVQEAMARQSLSPKPSPVGV